MIKYKYNKIVECPLCNKTRTVSKYQKSVNCHSCTMKRNLKIDRTRIIHRRHPDGISNMNALYGEYKRSAKNKGFDFNISKELFAELTKLNCHYCGEKPKQKGLHTSAKYGYWEHNGIDRIDSNLGYVIPNIVPCCSKCNYMKRELLVTDFLLHIEQIYKFNNKNI